MSPHTKKVAYLTQETLRFLSASVKLETTDKELIFFYFINVLGHIIGVFTSELSETLDEEQEKLLNDLLEANKEAYQRYIDKKNMEKEND